mmetsp:Transcript_34560/g.93615  ORF Transcript_34560/g.93615 Transcript_34560/m.93615 type:complete len:89 (-) Transcript_34560:1629-1895(-)
MAVVLAGDGVAATRTAGADMAGPGRTPVESGEVGCEKINRRGDVGAAWPVTTGDGGAAALRKRVLVPMCLTLPATVICGLCWAGCETL